MAWASDDGAQFSDHFLEGLSRGESLFQSFSSAQTAASIAHPSQVAWIDDDGDGKTQASKGPTVANVRGFTFENSFPDDAWPPFIAQIDPIIVNDGKATLRAEIRDDVDVALAYAVIYPPSYQAPTESEALVQEALPTTILLDAGNDQYTSILSGLDEEGTYRVVFYATDDQGRNARPLSVEVAVGGGEVYLPVTFQ